jgi:uncharacterized protein (TIGR02246 family)
MQPAIGAADELAVRNLLSRYAHLLDGRKPDEFAALFADDALLSAAGNELRGREQIRGFVVSLLDKAPGKHVTVNTDLRPASAHRVEATSDFVLLARHADSWSIARAGRYDDVLERDAAGVWRFRTRVIVLAS